MNLYLIEQSENTGYDTYDSAVVAAETETDAREIHPSEYSCWGDDYGQSWASSPDNVTAKLIGKADHAIESGVVLASFNAG